MIETLQLSKETIESIVSSRLYEAVDSFLDQKASPTNSEFSELFKTHGNGGFSSAYVMAIKTFHREMNELIGSKTINYIQSVSVKKSYLDVLELYLESL